MIKVKILKESGYEESLLGISLSYGADLEKMPKRAESLAHKGGGHSKFLESITVWIDITAPRYFHQQLDTYRVGVTKQSESTMHTTLKHELTSADFAGETEPSFLEHLNRWIREKNLEQVKLHLPEGFLQRRIMCCSYMSLQRMHAQRNSHKLLEWRDFCDALVDRLEHLSLSAKWRKNVLTRNKIPIAYVHG